MGRVIPNLGYIILLAVVAISFFVITSTGINLLFFDPKEFGFFTLEIVRFALATFVVAFPIFLFSVRYLEKEGHITDGTKSVAFFTSAAIIIIDAITVVFSFFNDGITAQFLLKALVVFIVALLILGYNSREDNKLVSKIPHRVKTLKYVSIILGVASILWIGSVIDVLHGKEVKQDLENLRSVFLTVDLIQIHGRPDDYKIDSRAWAKLPSNLDNLNIPGKTISEAITYTKTGNNSFMLCTEITRNIAIKIAQSRINYEYDNGVPVWENDEACFSFQYPTDYRMYYRG